MKFTVYYDCISQAVSGDSDVARMFNTKTKITNTRKAHRRDLIISKKQRKMIWKYLKLTVNHIDATVHWHLALILPGVGEAQRGSADTAYIYTQHH